VGRSATWKRWFFMVMMVFIIRIEWWFHDNPLGIDFDVVVMSAVFHGE
jgi:hypothetical protein